MKLFIFLILPMIHAHYGLLSQPLSNNEVEKEDYKSSTSKVCKAPLSFFDSWRSRGGAASKERKKKHEKKRKETRNEANPKRL